MKELSDKKFETPVHFCYADLFLSITQEKHIKIQSEFIKIVYGILTKAAKQLEEKDFCFKAYIGIIVLYNNKKKPVWLFLQSGFISQWLLSDQNSLFFCSALPFSSGSGKREYTLDFMNFPVKDFINICVSTCGFVRNSVLSVLTASNQ